VAQGQVLAAERDRDALARRALGEMGATRAAARDLAEEVGRAAAMLVEPARGALAAARAAFDTGAFDIMRLLDAERVYTDAALVALDLEIDAVLSAIEARVAAGEDPLP
jgi:outer membrane protein TolC